MSIKIQSWDIDDLLPFKARLPNIFITLAHFNCENIPWPETSIKIKQSLKKKAIASEPANQRDLSERSQKTKKVIEQIKLFLTDIQFSNWLCGPIGWKPLIWKDIAP